MKYQILHLLKILVISFSIFFQSCISTSILQTAKTLDKGETQIVGGASQYNFEGEFGLAPDLMIRKGINEKSDFGFGYSAGIMGHLRADYKYEILETKNKSNHISTGIGGDLYLNGWDEEANFVLLYLFIFR